MATGDRERLLNDAGIIRNRLKVDAAIHNAQVIQRLRASHGSFADWLDAHVMDGHASRQGRLGQAVQEDLPLHRRRDHQ